MDEDRIENLQRLLQLSDEENARLRESAQSAQSALAGSIVELGELRAEIAELRAELERARRIPA